MDPEGTKQRQKSIKVRRVDSETDAEASRDGKSSDATSSPPEAKSDEPEWRERYLRIAADIENTKKRLAKNAEQRVREQKEELILDLLPIADNLERILEHASREPDRDLEHGLRLTLRDFMARLGKYGVQPLHALGESFDPRKHEAIATVPHSEAPGGKVVRVEQRGYQMDGRLLRPARVLIAE